MNSVRNLLEEQSSCCSWSRGCKYFHSFPFSISHFISPYLLVGTNCINAGVTAAKRWWSHPAHWLPRCLLHVICSLVVLTCSTKIPTLGAFSYTSWTICFVPKSQACSFRPLNQPVLMLIPRASILHQTISSKNWMIKCSSPRAAPGGNSLHHYPSVHSEMVPAWQLCLDGNHYALCWWSIWGPGRHSLISGAAGKEQWEGKFNIFAW